MSYVQRENFLHPLNGPTLGLRSPWCGGQQSHNNLCSFRGRSPALGEVQEGVCLLWDGHRSTITAGEQRGLRETLAAKDSGSPFQLSEHLKPRDSALGNPGVTPCLTIPTSALSPRSLLQTELEDIPHQEFWGVQAILHPPPKEPPFSRPPPASSCN